MKVLFIGGTGTISSAISRKLVSDGHTLYLLNRGNRIDQFPDGVLHIKADIEKEEEVAEKIKDLSFDVVADFIAFKQEQVERDHRLFAGKTKQFMFISSASAYQKPLSHYCINEGTPLANPYWEYSRNKIACEDLLMKMYRENGFPITIIRPSHTFDERSIPLGVHGNNGSWQVIRRMIEGKPVIIHGDGTSLWTMTHNTDFAQGFVGLMGNAHAIGEAVQITTEDTYTWNQIYGMIADALNVRLHPYYVPSDFLDRCSPYDLRGSLLGDKANSVVFDNQKLKRLVPDFHPKKNLKDGLRETINYIMSHPEYQKVDEEFDIWCDSVIEYMEEAAVKLQQIWNSPEKK